jgi:predicted RNase H-like HicB family nuclease
MSAQTYRAIVTREGRDWLADVPELEGAHTFARTLPKLMQYVREVIVLAEDLPDEAMKDLDIDFVYHTGDPDIDRVAQKVRRDRIKIAKAEKTLRSSTTITARKLLRSGMSTRDVATILDISHQRVDQIARRETKELVD